MTMKTVIGGLVLALESIIIHSMGYTITTWQWSIRPLLNSHIASVAPFKFCPYSAYAFFLIYSGTYSIFGSSPATDGLPLSLNFSVLINLQTLFTSCASSYIVYNCFSPIFITCSGLPQRGAANGEFLLFDWNFEISTVHSFDGSNIVISASASIDKLPLLILSILDGLTAIFSISSFKVKTPDFTGIEVPIPMMFQNLRYRLMQVQTRNFSHQYGAVRGLLRYNQSFRLSIPL